MGMRSAITPCPMWTSIRCHRSGCARRSWAAAMFCCVRRVRRAPISGSRSPRPPTSSCFKSLDEAGYRTCLSYDLDSMDWTDPGARAVRDNVAAAGPGSIVSMHLGHSDTVSALPGILDDLRRRGLSAVTVTTLLSP